MPGLSAGILLRRLRDSDTEVLIGHPGGPFWAHRDDGAWTIRKGADATREDPWDAARREFTEELDRVAWLPPAMARPKLLKSLRESLDRLAGRIG